MAEGAQTRGGAGRLTVPLGIVAVASVGAFLYWLYVTAQPTTVAVVQEEVPTDTAFTSVPATDFALFATGPQNYVGMRVRFDSIKVASRLGTQAFWTQLPNETPFLVRLDSALVASGIAVASGEVLRLVGTVHKMTDSVLDDWEARQVLADDMQRAEAEFATTFIQADRAEVKGNPPAAGEGASGAQSGGQANQSQ
ncbi:MAG: hypothetical protein HY704_07235 [Gemmatimonadetes bacterium]|nr:hypothetical protein [Gemmatimonadota bacterium]